MLYFLPGTLNPPHVASHQGPGTPPGYGSRGKAQLINILQYLILNTGGKKRQIRGKDIVTFGLQPLHKTRRTK
jgi:hypothetical protein